MITVYKYHFKLKKKKKSKTEVTGVFKKSQNQKWFLIILFPSLFKLMHIFETLLPWAFIWGLYCLEFVGGEKKNIEFLIFKNNQVLCFFFYHFKCVSPLSFGVTR